MATAQLGTLLRHLKGLAAGHGEQHRTDRQLLDDFAARRDEGAFAGLVYRHGPMVLGVCRRVLRHEQDAEDAFQATFLVLARHSGSIRRREALASWLYGVAHRTAMKAKRGAARRRKHEARLRERTPTAAPGPRWDDVQAVLDEEVQRLPESFRSAFVLCVLQGQTVPAAAAELGVKESTLSWRLRRARQRLRQRLARRGIQLSAVLAALSLAHGAAQAAVPAALARTTIRFGLWVAAGEPAAAIPSHVAALAAGVTRAMWISKLKVATTVLLAAALMAGAGALALPGLAGGEAPKMPAATKADSPAPGAKPAVEERTITGRVLGADGKPIRADLFLLWLEGAPEPLGKTAGDGTFRVTVPLKGPGAYLVARADGHGVDFMMPATNTPADVTFRLPKDTPIRGRVIDTQGRPVAGVELGVSSVNTFSKERLDRFLAAMKTRASHEPIPAGERSFWVRRDASHTLPNGERLLAAKTDADGQFTIRNVGSDCTAWVDLKGGGIAEHTILVVNREGFDPAPINRAEQERRQRYGRDSSPTLAGPQPTIVAEAEKVIRGVVKETDTGKPRAGVRVTLDQDDFRQRPRLSAVTDAKGRYEIRGAKKAASYRLSVPRDTTDAMLGRTVEVPDTSIGLEPQTADIGVAKGVLLTGRVLNVATGKPVPGFACVGILAGNTAIKSRPEFAAPDCYEQAATDKDGTFRTVVIPGPLLLMGGPWGWAGDGADVSVKYKQQRTDPAFPKYFDEAGVRFRDTGGGQTIIQGQSSKVLLVRADAKTFTADVLLQPATGFAVKFRDPDGKPLRETLIAGNTSQDWTSPVSNATDAGTVYDLDTHHPRLIVVYQPRRQLVAAVTLKGGEKAPFAVTLLPAGSAKGKLVDADGKPLANAAVRIGYFDRPADEIHRIIAGGWYESGKEGTTNAAGEFVVGQLIPGRKFAVTAFAKGKDYEPPEIESVKGYAAQSGKTTDLGTIPLRASD
jgi:RNA polymerase sigma factor (sigma-70 family)